MVSVSLIVLASVFNTFMDLSSEGKLKAKFNKEESWKNKYKEGTLEPRFFLSTSFLAFTTDLWHFMKMCMVLCLCGAIVFYKPLNWNYLADFRGLNDLFLKSLDFMVLWFTFGAVHELSRCVFKLVKK